MADDMGAMAAPQGLAAPQPALRQEIQEGILFPHRGAAVSLGFFSGWLAVDVCSLGIMPAFLTGFGISGYTSSTILGGLGWTPVVGLFAIALVFSASYLLTRRVFATRPREIALPTYWRVVRTMAYAGGISFVAWTLLGMSVIYAVGGG
jgi:hypothetical protein